MRTPPVLRLAGAIHHLALRSAAGQPLFVQPSDRVFLDDLVGEFLGHHRARAHAYCWMTNHLHLAIEIEPDRVAAFQQELCVAYQQHLTGGTCGDEPVFAPSRPALRVAAHPYLLRLVRYIHLNPVRAGLVADAGDYPWSGHRAYLGYPGVPWLCRDLALRLLGGDLLRAVAAYRVFVTPQLIELDRESLVMTAGYPGRY